jgi:hypothetical protein
VHFGKSFTRYFFREDERLSLNSATAAARSETFSLARMGDPRGCAASSCLKLKGCSQRVQPV